MKDPGTDKKPGDDHGEVRWFSPRGSRKTAVSQTSRCAGKSWKLPDSSKATRLCAALRLNCMYGHARKRPPLPDESGFHRAHALLPRLDRQRLCLSGSKFFHGKHLPFDHAQTRTPGCHPGPQRSPSRLYGQSADTDNSRPAFAANHPRPVLAGNPAMLTHEFLVMLAGGVQRLPFPAMGLIRKEGIVYFPLASQPDKEAISAPGRLVNSRDSGVWSWFGSSHVDRSISGASMRIHRSYSIFQCFEKGGPVPAPQRDCPPAWIAWKFPGPSSRQRRVMAQLQIVEGEHPFGPCVQRRRDFLDGIKGARPGRFQHQGHLRVFRKLAA